MARELVSAAQDAASLPATPENIRAYLTTPERPDTEICRFCGWEFEPTRKGQIYCKRSCTTNASKRRRMLEYLAAWLDARDRYRGDN